MIEPAHLSTPLDAYQKAWLALDTDSFREENRLLKLLIRLCKQGIWPVPPGIGLLHEQQETQ